LFKKSTIDLYYTIVVARSSSRIRDYPFSVPGFDAQVYILEHDVQTLEKIRFSMAEILDIRIDILLDPRKHDQLLFDDDSFSRSRKY